MKDKVNDALKQHFRPEFAPGAAGNVHERRRPLVRGNLRGVSPVRGMPVSGPAVAWVCPVDSDVMRQAASPLRQVGTRRRLGWCTHARTNSDVRPDVAGRQASRAARGRLCARRVCTRVCGRDLGSDRAVQPGGRPVLDGQHHHGCRARRTGGTPATPVKGVDVALIDTGVSPLEGLNTAGQDRLRPGSVARVAVVGAAQPRHERARHVHGRSDRRARLDGDRAGQRGACVCVPRHGPGCADRLR